MDKTTKQKQSYEESNEEHHKDEEYNKHSQRIKESESNYKLKQNKINSISQKNQRTYSHSCSPCSTKRSKKWISSNAFINFVQDFRQNFVGMKGTRIYQLAGERWRRMTAEEKDPYVKAALNVKNQKQNQIKIENTNKFDINKEQVKNQNSQKQEKPSKNERKNKEPTKSTKKKRKIESDTDSITSGTSISNTSEDLSDMNS